MHGRTAPRTIEQLSHERKRRHWSGKPKPKPRTQPGLGHCASYGTPPAFSIVDPAGTWAWRSGPVDAAAVRQGAVLALLPAEAAVQLRVEAAGVDRCGEAPVVELSRRAEVAMVASPRSVEAAVAELPRRAEVPVDELPRRAEVPVVELLRHAEAAAVESVRRVEAAVAELPRRAEAAPRWLEACSQEALKRRYPWRYRCR